MRLSHLTWPDAEAALSRHPAVFLPVGSIEQHGPMGLIGTDALCAETLALAAAERVGAVVAPPVAYTPAPFNMAFPGTVSVSAQTFAALVREVVQSLAVHGVSGVYVVNGHGANLAPLKTLSETMSSPKLKVRSWWDFKPVNAIRQERFGVHEGMHATPSEVAITMAVVGPLPVPAEAAEPPAPLPPGFIEAHAGDRHGPPDAHRAAFPDGRVGSHSALATEEVGRALVDAAGAAIAEDFLAFCTVLGWQSSA
ncbi:MAG: creatininase family protein [Pseudomonadota bacterium]